MKGTRREKQRRREYEPGFEESEAARQLARIAPYLEYRGQRVISPLGLLQGERVERGSSSCGLV